MITTDKALFDFEVIYGYISQSYWAKDIPKKVMRAAIENSLCFGVFEDDKQVGFARVITDSATFAYLDDVFILPDYQGRGLSKELMTEIIEHRQLQGLRRMMLATVDAHGLYTKFGFSPVANSSILMENWQPDIYEKL